MLLNLLQKTYGFIMKGFIINGDKNAETIFYKTPPRTQIELTPPPPRSFSFAFLLTPSPPSATNVLFEWPLK